MVCLCLFQIHTEFQISFPDDAVETPGEDSSASTGPPTSFVAWAELNSEDMEGASSEQEKDSKPSSDPLESNVDECCEEDTVTPENPSEECNSGQGDYPDYV